MGSTGTPRQRPSTQNSQHPDHQGNVTRLASLGTYEHWNNPEEKQYSRNLGRGKGIELVKLRGTAGGQGEPATAR